MRKDVFKHLWKLLVTSDRWEHFRDENMASPGISVLLILFFRWIKFNDVFKILELNRDLFLTIRTDIKSNLLAAWTLFSLFLHHIHRGNCTYVRRCVHNAQPCIHKDFQAYTNCKLHEGYTLAHKIPLYVRSHSMHA